MERRLAPQGPLEELKKQLADADEALKGAARSRIHTFIATSELHMEKKLRMTRDQVFEQARQSVRFARNLVGDIEFSPEDAARTEVDFLCTVVEAAIGAGATTVNIPDTVGYSTPTEYGAVIAGICHNVPNIHKAIISTHCHDDLERRPA